MADARTEQLLSASFRGVSFLVESEAQTDAGRKIVLHEYPNSDTRYIEDLGQIPPQFSVRAFVTGDDWLSRSDSLKTALSESGPGRLVMPTFGALDAFALPFKVDASQKTIGKISFQLKFAVGKVQPAPAVAPFTEQSVFALGDDFRDTLADSFGELWILPTDQSGAATAQSDIIAALESIKDAVSGVAGLQELEEVIKQADIIGSDIFSLTRDGVELGKELYSLDGQGLFELVSVSLGFGEGFDAAISLTNFGAGLPLLLADIFRATPDIDELSTGATASTAVPLWPGTTRQRIDRNRNRITSVRSIRLGALACAYEQAAARTYKTVQQIDETRATVENAHHMISIIETSDRDAPQSQNAVKDALEGLRIASLSVLEQKEQQSFKLDTIMPKVPKSALVLSQQLYAEEFKVIEDIESRAVEISGLNKSDPSSLLEGDVKIFQVGSVQR